MSYMRTAILSYTLFSFHMIVLFTCLMTILTPLARGCKITSESIFTKEQFRLKSHSRVYFNITIYFIETSLNRRFCATKVDLLMCYNGYASKVLPRYQCSYCIAGLTLHDFELVTPFD